MTKPLPVSDVVSMLSVHIVNVVIPEGSSFRMGTISIRRLPRSPLYGPKDWSPRGQIPVARR